MLGLRFQGAAFAILILSLPAIAPVQSATPPLADLTDEEYAVYGVVLDSFRAAKKASHPVVADQTATFACHATCNGMEIGGCNGLRGEHETPAQRLAIVRRDLPQLDSATTSDFESKSQRCATVASKIPAKARYILSPHEGDYVPDGWESPDYFFFSRVAFDPGRTQALVVVGFMSGTQARDSEGKYFLFVKRSGVWRLQGTSFIWKLQP